MVQVVGPGLPGEPATLLRARVTSVDLLMPLQLARKGEAHFTPFVGAPVRGHLGVLLAHVRLQLLVLPELQATAVEPAQVALPVRAVHAADVPGPVGVGGEGFHAAVHGAAERLRAAVAEVMPGQVILTAEGLSTSVAATCERFSSRVFTQMRVQFPLFVISCRTSRKRANKTLVSLRFSFHCRGIGHFKRQEKLVTAVTNTFSNFADISHDHPR